MLIAIEANNWMLKQSKFDLMNNIMSSAWRDIKLKNLSSARRSHAYTHLSQIVHGFHAARISLVREHDKRTHAGFKILYFLSISVSHHLKLAPSSELSERLALCRLREQLSAWIEKEMKNLFVNLIPHFIAVISYSHRHTHIYISSRQQRKYMGKNPIHPSQTSSQYSSNCELWKRKKTLFLLPIIYDNSCVLVHEREKQEPFFIKCL